MSTALSGGVFESSDSPDDFTELRQLVDSIGTRSFQTRIGNRAMPDVFDAQAWRHLEEAGLTRLTSTPESGGGPAELALILRMLAYHCVTVPLGETDVMAGWLAAKSGLEVPDAGPLSIAIGEMANTNLSVPYAGSAAAVLVVLRARDGISVTKLSPLDLSITPGHNLGGEPRDVATISGTLDGSVMVGDVSAEFTRRGAWIRCMQTVGALDAAVESSVAHCRDRTQFGRPLSAFQAVQHSLASMAGEVERARAAATLAVAAATDFGFNSTQTDYAVTVAKTVLGRVVPKVVTTAHQLHGAIGVTSEHRLWLATMRARSWIAEFGDTAWYASRLGRMAMGPAGDPWDLTIGRPSAAPPY